MASSRKYSDVSRGRMYVLFAAILMGTLPLFVRELPLDGIQITFYRLGSAAIVLFLLGRREELFKVKKIKLFILLGLFQGMTIVLYISAIQKTTVANAVMLLYLFPIYVCLSAPIITKEEPSRRNIILLIIALLGVALLIEPQKSFGTGEIYGLLAGIFNAGLFLVLKKIGNESSIKTMFWGTLVPTLFLMPLFIAKPVFFPSIWIAGLAIVPTAVPFIMLAKGIKTVKTEEASIIALAEPLCAMVLGVLIFGEFLGAIQIIGIAIVIAVIFAINKN